MKRRDLIQHLVRHGCQFDRQGGRHAVYLNPANGNLAPMPRHREIKENMVAKICKELGIPRP